MRAPTKNRHRGQEGIALIYVALFLLVSLWFVSLAIDAGKLMAAKTELQAAADAAALAGASAIDPLTAQTIPALAKARAAAAAASNSAYEGLKTSVVINPDVDVEFPAERQVKVTVYRNADHGNPVLLHFAQTLGIPSIGVSADATAHIGPIIDLCEGIAPFAPEVLPSGEDFSKDCGSEYTLKLGAGSGTTGNYQLLSYPDCPESVPTGNVGGGGAAVRYYIVNGWDCCFKIGDMMEVDTEPGNKVGPVRQALTDRFNADDNTDQGICYQEYIDNGGNGSRVFLCPVIEDFNETGGRHTVKVVKFAAFFLKDKPNGSLVQNGITGQFIDYIAVGKVGDQPPLPTDLYGVHLIE